MSSDHPDRDSGRERVRLENLSVVLPAFNEEQVIREVVSSISRFLPSVADRFEVIVVDDGSTDRTGAILEEMMETDPALVAIHHSRNRGYGAALRTGFSRARFDHVFYTDSDGQFDISEIHQLLPHISHADIVTGYRRNRKDPLHRKLNAALLRTFARVILGLRLRDIDCAFKVYRKEVLDSIDLLSDGILIDTEIFCKARRKGFSVREVPVSHFPRTKGTPTGSRADVLFRVIRELPKLFRDHS